MMYSCAIFDDADMSLDDAARRKLDTVCRKLALRPGDRVIEIGTGWGGFALHAAGRYGCYVTTTTISEEQYRFARQRIAEAGLEDRVEVLKLDYRDLLARGKSYDKLVSIEMIEAVGERFLPGFFRTCSQLLEPHGLVLLQAITISDALYDDYRKSVDFIQRYIFPGGFLPSVSAMSQSIAAQTDLQLFDLDDLTAHYPVTLQHWRKRLFAQRDALLELGYSETLYRMWDYYFSYCEGGFLERTVGNVQLLLSKPQAIVDDLGSHWRAPMGATLTTNPDAPLPMANSPVAHPPSISSPISPAAGV